MHAAPGATDDDDFAKPPLGLPTRFPILAYVSCINTCPPGLYHFLTRGSTLGTKAMRTESFIESFPTPFSPCPAFNDRPTRSTSPSLCL
ncbi:hypothetical protein BDR06DRAFT_950735 [Suillus hirtellus]|nr:hypothetical protein BDR06DRAFT_950735 [Suillus hirtellus]